MSERGAPVNHPAARFTRTLKPVRVHDVVAARTILIDAPERCRNSKPTICKPSALLRPSSFSAIAAHGSPREPARCNQATPLVAALRVVAGWNQIILSIQLYRRILAFTSTAGWAEFLLTVAKW